MKDNPPLCGHCQKQCPEFIVCNECRRIMCLDHIDQSSYSMWTGVDDGDNVYHSVCNDCVQNALPFVNQTLAIKQEAEDRVAAIRKQWLATIPYKAEE